MHTKSKKNKKGSPNRKPTIPINRNLKTQEVPKDLTKQSISLCLVMIVKDEEDTIRRCLTQVAPFISYYVICDTGSNDNTIAEIKSTMADLGIEGEVHERPWVNFEVN